MQKKKWDQALKYATQVAQSDPSLTFTYELLNVHFLGQNEILKEETIPMHLLGSLFLFHIYDIQGNEKLAEIESNKLMQNIANSEYPAMMIIRDTYFSKEK